MPTLERVPDRSPAMLRTVATALGALLCAAPALAQEYPRVELVYQHVPFDLSCEQWRNTKIEQSWKEEVESKIAAYQEFWNKEAPLLLEAVVSEVGKPFQRKEMLAVLKLGRSEQLKEIIARDSAAPNPAYRRAWQIVNDIEGHQAFVAELRR